MHLDSSILCRGESNVSNQQLAIHGYIFWSGPYEEDNLSPFAQDS